MISRALIVAGCVGLAVFAVAAEVGERLEDVSYVPYEHPAIQYFQTPTNNSVNRLDERLDKGEEKLDFQAGGLGYLPSVLKQFGINVDSQVLVFTKSSFQAPLISPERPRAIYFNDEVSIGFVQHGEVMEVSAFDPTQGVAFYTLNTGKTAKPSFARREVCLQCHQGGQTLGVPGLVVSSQYVPRGAPAEHVRGGFVTDDRTPISDRWGGWYVSGKLGANENRGIPTGHGVDARFDTSPYLSPDSDVVALLTLEHQTRMTNLITRIGWDTRIAIADKKLDESRAKIEAGIEDMVGYMLFADEAEFKGPIEGVSTFTKTFPERGPRDKQGRSLRDFDLQKRLFKYPLSYMIYTKAFDSMPAWARDRVYRRLYEVLSGKDTSERFARLSADDRRNVLEIVRETKPGLPDYWK
jgi:hypothetical protein